MHIIRVRSSYVNSSRGGLAHSFNRTYTYVQAPVQLINELSRAHLNERSSIFFRKHLCLFTTLYTTYNTLYVETI